MPSLFIATGNAHKIDELRRLLGSDFNCRSQRDIGSNLAIEETGKSFAENACLKGVAWAAHLSASTVAGTVDWVLADDSGLEVDALGGAPGILSARFAAADEGRSGNSSDAENNAKLLRLLANVPTGQRGARFRCVLAMTPIGLNPAAVSVLSASTRYFEGSCDGHILMQPAGCGGFGYDPLFVPDGQSASFAALGDTIKNSISHRARAVMKLRRFFSETSRHG